MRGALVNTLYVGRCGVPEKRHGIFHRQADLNTPIVTTPGWCLTAPSENEVDFEYATRAGRGTKPSFVMAQQPAVGRPDAEQFSYLLVPKYSHSATSPDLKTGRNRYSCRQTSESFLNHHPQIMTLFAFLRPMSHRIPPANRISTHLQYNVRQAATIINGSWPSAKKKPFFFSTCWPIAVTPLANTGP